MSFLPLLFSVLGDSAQSISLIAITGVQLFLSPSLIKIFVLFSKRRALRTASEKVRNRSSFSTNVIHNTPGSRVNRYISRLIEARQTESEMADLHFVTLTYKQAEREKKVSYVYKSRYHRGFVLKVCMAQKGRSLLCFC